MKTCLLPLSRSVLAVSMLALSAASSVALTLYQDSFQTYPVQNPAPNPLTNGPAGGQWYFVDPDGTTTVNEHRIWDSTTVGSGLNSRVWGSSTNNARLTNSISLSKLPSGDSHILRLSFVVATDTSSAGRSTAFAYDFKATGGTLTLLSAGNADGSQVLDSASGIAIANSEIKGKSADRTFQFVFQATGLKATDNFVFDITRVTNNAGSTLTFLLDDVELLVDETTNAPLVLRASPVYSLQHARISFSEPLDPQSATNAANYTIAGLSVLNAWMLDSRQVEIQTADQTPGKSYSVQVSGVKGQNNVAIATTSVGFTAPALVSGAVKYDAGTTTTQPAGAPDPTSAAGNDWTVNVNTQPGMTKESVLDDNGTGLNAWKVSDDNSASNGGSIVYNTAVDPFSDVFARSNGWRLVMRARYTTNNASTAADQIFLYGDPAVGVRSGVFLGINTNGLFATLLGGGGTSSGNTYTLTNPENATNYHTHVLAYDPAKSTLSYYFDGKLVAADFGPQVVANVNGVQFGSASSAGKGEVNYNLVRLDVGNATAPVVVVPPKTSTNGVGQKVTFSAIVTPWVNAYQWLSNDVPIAGATGSNYTTSFISLANSGEQYKLRIYSGFGNIETAPATLWVTDDTNAPTIVSVRSLATMESVRITFSEPVQDIYATDPANYTWSTPGVSTVSAAMVDPFTVELKVSGLTAGNAYSLQVSNVRDTSNLPIAVSSPAAFTTPKLQVLARYYAGTAQDAPAGPPDPTSAAGGSWLHTYNEDPGIATNAIVNDGGWNAWQVVDTVTADNRKYNNYHFPLSAADHQAARQFGWLLSVRAKLLDGNTSGTSAIFAQYEDDRYFRNILNLAFDTAADLRVGLWETNGFAFNTVTAGGTGFFDYHMHQVAYDPVSQTASYYFDGQLIKGNWSPSYIGTNSVAELFWGAVASIPIGTANLNLFEFSVVSGPTVSVGLNGANVEVTYRGVLEAAPQLNSTAWTPIATNLNSAPAVLTVPASGQAQQFFRARNP